VPQLVLLIVSLSGYLCEDEEGRIHVHLPREDEKEKNRR
jgi:hypothetical protein